MIEKLVFSEIRSRHSKCLKYKVFIQYDPKIENDNSIDEWYCTCRNGARTVGCCSHISSLIYYLSIGRYSQNLKIPGKDLEKIFSTPCTLESSDISEDEVNILNDKSSNEKGLEPLEITLKHSLSFDEFPESKKRPEKKSNQNFTDLDDVFGHALPWNGFLEITRISKISLKSTCTIDYYLFGLRLSSRISKNFTDKLMSSKPYFKNLIQEIIEEKIELIEEKKYNRAKTIWITKICNLKNVNNSYSTEHEFTLKYLNQFQTYSSEGFCPSCGYSSRIKKWIDIALEKDKSNNVIILL
ncbi:unnamed protein product [Brachionus calyciflorus]|uniref:SWIM-type domain-containing protein n=1 Tax=Brachionus calyciflorus TaxID=104777 RepID=A0A813YH81_9BILA|nr:unnamed protein product [Brachionus calyciflorus]